MPELGQHALSQVDATDFHVISDIAAAREILEDTAGFRVASINEFVPRMSSSFFLAASMSDESGAARCHAELAAYLAPNHMPRLCEALRGAAEKVSQGLPTGEPFDIKQDCLQPYGRLVASVFSGLPLEEVITLAAAMSVAAQARIEADDARSSKVLAWAWNRLHVSIANGRPTGSLGLPEFAMSRGRLTNREVALLTMPLVEMAAYDRNTAIARIALAEIRRGSLNLAQIFECGGIRDFLLGASALIDGLYVTRVARQNAIICGTQVRPGDRVIIDVTSSNKMAAPHPGGAQRVTSHIAFGWGPHACIARELSLQINAAILEALASRGRLDALAVPDIDAWVITHHPPAAPMR